MRVYTLEHEGHHIYFVSTWDLVDHVWSLLDEADENFKAVLGTRDVAPDDLDDLPEFEGY